MEIGRWLIISTILFAILSGCAGKDIKLVNRGSEAIIMQDYLGAEKYLGEALAVNPDNTQALFNMGIVYENTGRQQQAISMYQKVLDLETAKGKKISPENQEIIERARTNLKKLQMEIAATAPPIERSGMNRSEEPDLKDFFPALKTQETDEPTSDQDQGMGSAMAEGPVKSETPAPPQEPTLIEPAAPTLPSEPPVQPPVSIEPKKAEEGKSTPPPEPQKTETPKTIYSIQVASYKNLDAAVKRIAELIDLGYDASYKKATIKGETWHRIFVDEFTSKQEATKQAQSMVDKKVITDFMIKVIQ